MDIFDLFQGIGTMFTLEPLIMIPMGLGMTAVNAGVLFMENNEIGNLIINPMLTDTDALMKYMQIDFLQPIYNFTFSNGLIACLVFMGIGIMCDVGFVLAHPFISMTIAMFAELGTIATYPIAKLMGLSDGAANAILCLLFPVAAPLFLSFFVGIVIKESGLTKYIKLIEDGFLYFATFFLGLMLGVLCDASTLLDPIVLKLLVLGMLALLLSGIGGIIGGYVVYFLRKGNFNPTVGIAGVSCVPSTAKVAQKAVSKANRNAFIMDYALGANICGVITTAILTSIYITMLT